MRAAILASAVILAAMPALASDRTDALAAAKAYAADVNKGDAAAGSALCTGQAVVIDDFPPHVWQGATACADWAAAFASMAKAEGDTDAHVATGEPKALTVSGDRAYAVLPANFTYKQRGKPVNEPGLWTFSLQKTEGGWRITGWAWASK
jgi:ketosteroid isomerase-like protein